MTILSQNRIAAGVPTGGQFVAHDRADSATSLAEKPYAQALTEVLDDLQRQVQSAQRYIAAHSIIAKLRNMHPGGELAKWRIDSAGRTHLVEVVNAVGAPVPPVNHLGAYLTPELNTLGNDPISHLSKSGTSSYDPRSEEQTFVTDIASIDIERRRAEWEQLNAVLPDEHLPMIAREAIRTETRHRFPTAAVITVEDQNEGGVGAPYYLVVAVQDRAGETLWSHDDQGDDFEYDSYVNDHAPLLDRDGRNDSTIKLHV